MRDKKYLEIVDLLRRSIRSGSYENGQKLPSENQWAQKTGYSRTTVRQAMVILEREGLVQRIQGSGTYARLIPLSPPRTMNIGVITTYINEYIFPFILQGINGVLSQNGYMPLMAETKNLLREERRVLSSFLQKPIDALIVEGTKTAVPNSNQDLYQAFVEKGIPIVFINGYYPDTKKPIYVVMNDREGGRMLCQWLIEKGHTRIAGFFKSDDIQGQRRYAGFVEALKQARLPIEDAHILWYTTQDRDLLIERRGKEILEGCTAALCYNDETALCAMKICGPDGVEWVSFDHSSYAQIAYSPLHSLVHPSQELGALAAQKALNMLQGKPEAPAILDWAYPDDMLRL